MRRPLQQSAIPARARDRHQQTIGEASGVGQKLQTILGVSEEREPGGALRGGLGPVVPGEYTAHDVLVDLDSEYEGELLSDPAAAESRIPALHLDDGSDQLWGRPFGSRLSTALRREQKSILAPHQGAVECQDRRRLEHDR